jgi:exonuclease I
VIYLVHDFETGDKNPYSCQPIQWAGLALDKRTLKPIDKFEVKIRPYLDDEQCKQFGLAPVSDEALSVTGTKREDLPHYTPLDEAFAAIVQWVQQLTPKKGLFNGPISVGFNSTKFDDVIMKRLICGNFYFAESVGIAIPDGKKEPYKFGPQRKDGEQDLFNYVAIDVLQQMRFWLDNLKRNSKSMSMDALREYFDLRSLKNHDALSDVYATAALFARFEKYARSHASNSKFERSFGGTTGEEYVGEI